MIEVRVLGPLEVSRNGQPMAIGSPTQRAIIAVLAAASHTVPRGRLVDAVWGDEPPRTAEASLMGYVSRLRAALGADAVTSGPAGYSLVAHRADVHRFEQCLALARAAAGDAAAVQLSDALALWRGPAYGEFAGHPYVVTEARRLEELRVQARCDLAGSVADVGDLGRAVGILQALVAEHPLNEGAWAMLIGALASGGRNADALRAAQRCRDELEGVGLTPSEPILEAEREALAGGPAGGKAGGSPVEGNVPHLVSSFVGRRDDVARVVNLLEHTRCVTLLGPGGVGKTRLAIEIAHALPTKPGDGVWFCDLGRVDDPTGVVAAVAATLQLPLAGDSQERVREFCRPRTLLMVLDNCEHLIDEVARVAEMLLRSGPSVRVVATSRERLGVEGEHLVDVLPLDVANEAVALFVARAGAASRQFSLDDHANIREVCRRLDGLPLAIEMAAPLTRSMTVQALASSLDRRLDLLRSDRRLVDPRHRSLREVIASSYESLSPAQQRALERLSVFVGDFSVEAAAEIVTEPSERAESGAVAEMLRTLAARSIVTPVGSASTRFRMLETVAEYASDFLARSGDRERVVKRQCSYFAQLAEDIRRGLEGPDEHAWVTLAEQEMTNLGAAQHRAMDLRLIDEAMRIPAALYSFVLDRLRPDVAAWAGRSLDLTEAAGHPFAPVVRATCAVGRLQSGNLDAAEELAIRAIGDAGDSLLVRFPTHVLVELGLVRGTYDTCIRHADTVIRLAGAAGDEYLATHALFDQILARGYAGDIDGALASVGEFREKAESVGAPSLLAAADFGEGEFLVDSDPARAGVLLDCAVAAAHNVGNAFLEGAARLSATTVLARHGDASEALVAFGGTIRHWYRTADWVHQWTTLRNLIVLLGRLGADESAATLLGATEGHAGSAFGPERERLESTRAALSSRLGERRFLLAQERGRRLDRDDVVRLALATTDSH